MARLVFCPRCGGTHPVGARCPSLPKRERKPTAADATRAEREPWRSEYGTAEYRRERQEAIARTRGRCADCGRVCAEKRNGRWTTAALGGEVHHERALRDGGPSSKGNLVLLCRSCHAKRDAARRRG